MVASVIAAVVSSLTSIFNSSSAIFTMDIWSNIRKAASEREKIIVGRCVEYKFIRNSSQMGVRLKICDTVAMQMM